MIRNTILLIVALVAFPVMMHAQRVEEVNGKYTLVSSWPKGAKLSDS